MSIKTDYFDMEKDYPELAGKINHRYNYNLSTPVDYVTRSSNLSEDYPDSTNVTTINLEECYENNLRKIVITHTSTTDYTILLYHTNSGVIPQGYTIRFYFVCYTSGSPVTHLYSSSQYSRIYSREANLKYLSCYIYGQGGYFELRYRGDSEESWDLFTSTVSYNPSYFDQEA